MASSGGGISLSWAQLWAYLANATDDIRKDTLRTLDIEHCLAGAIPKVQKEMLEFAPDYIKNMPGVKKIMHPEAVIGARIESKDSKFQMDLMTQYRNNLEIIRKSMR